MPKFCTLFPFVLDPGPLFTEFHPAPRTCHSGLMLGVDFFSSFLLDELFCLKPLAIRLLASDERSARYIPLLSLTISLPFCLYLYL